MKHCIFHIPYKLDADAKAAPMLRPRKMIEGFRNIGYQVDIIEGSVKERKEKIKQIKKKIWQGMDYDFMYSESSTMPTILTGKGHLPTHPFLDFSFFRFVKKRGIKIGLFYRDIYWKFDSYKKNLPIWKSYPAILCYKYDLKQYKKLLDKLYLASEGVYPYIQSKKLDQIVDVLMPGSENLNVKNDKYVRDFVKQPLSIFYVGGLGSLYQIDELMKAIKSLPTCRLTICCRMDEWNREKVKLESFLSPNIDIIHKSGADLEHYYEEADICSLLLKPDILREIAIPYKSFEYISHEKPVLASKNTAIGELVEKNDIGWTIPYSAVHIEKVLLDILDNPDILNKRREMCKLFKEQNTWEKRAEKVALDLKK